MVVLETFIVAFSMFSAIPMPQIMWNEKNMKYAMCAFPFIGAVIGVILCIWQSLSSFFGFGNMFFSAAFTIIPVVITGGIHIDGFCDTVDALSSHGDREKKLKILSDSNSGAFAIIWLICYMIMFFGSVSEIKFGKDLYPVIILMFVLSRSLSAFAVAVFPYAKNSGLMHSFGSMAAKRNVRNIVGIYIALISIGLIFFGRLTGIFVLIAAFLVFGIYYKVSKKEFGGITGDLAGWFLTTSELAMIFSVVIAQHIGGFLA